MAATIHFNQYRGYPDRVKTLLESAKTQVDAAAKGVITAAASGISTIQGAVTAPMSGTSTGTTASLGIIGQAVAYLFGILIILIIITLIVHYFVTPVYRTKPGAPGLITIPWTDNGVVFWNGEGLYPGVSLIKNKDLPISNAYYNYSFIVDIFIQNPMQFSTKPRIILSRGAQLQENPSNNNDITSVLSNYNFAIALKPDITDLVISALNVHQQPEDIDIKNVPVQTPFRLGVVIMQKVMEIYINGRLMKTKKFEADLADVTGDIRPALGNELNIAKLQNLKIWNSILSANEMVEATPRMASASSFNAQPIPSSSSCPPPPTNTTRIASSIMNAGRRLSM